MVTALLNGKFQALKPVIVCISALEIAISCRFSSNWVQHFLTVLAWENVLAEIIITILRGVEGGGGRRFGFWGPKRLFLKKIPLNFL